jgi:hypothetical protein
MQLSAAVLKVFEPVGWFVAQHDEHAALVASMAHAASPVPPLLDPLDPLDPLDEVEEPEEPDDDEVEDAPDEPEEEDDDEVEDAPLEPLEPLDDDVDELEPVLKHAKAGGKSPPSDVFWHAKPVGHATFEQSAEQYSLSPPRASTRQNPSGQSESLNATVSPSEVPKPLHAAPSFEASTDGSLLWSGGLVGDVSWLGDVDVMVQATSAAEATRNERELLK